MRKLLAVVVGAVAWSGCGGASGDSGIDATDKDLADAFWDGRSKVEADFLCEQLSTAEGRLRSSREIADELPNTRLNDIDESSTDEENLDALLDSTQQIGINDERGEKIALYLHEAKC
jgi:hypothetical protein